jgi:cytochrome c oxidase subunit 2
MGFNKLINSKKILSLFAAFVLFGTNMLMAQTETSGSALPADAAAQAAQKADMWTGVAYYTLLFLLLCVSVAVIGKILKVYDLTLQLQGKKGINWNNVIGIICLIFLVAGLYGAYWSLTVQGNMILPESASEHGVKIDFMFWTTTIITLIVFVITQVLLFGFAFKYRGSDKRKGYYYPHNNTVEKIWTVIPAIVLTILVVFGFFTWRTVTNTTEVKGDILGVNFKDKNSYDDLKADTLVLPVNRSIRINIHAQDVIHSFFMPHFRVQMNAVPGLPTFFKFTPTITTAEMRNRLDNPKFEYTLYCNKICGGGHYNMQKAVRVVTEAEYQDWISKQKPYLSEQLKKELKFADASQQKSVVEKRLALNN